MDNSKLIYWPIKSFFPSPTVRCEFSQPTGLVQYRQGFELTLAIAQSPSHLAIA